MKHTTYMNRTAILSLLSLGFGASAVQAAEPEIPQVAPVEQTPQSEPGITDIEDSDPFDKSTGKPESKAAKDQNAEMLDAQARILFARGETEKAIALQTQAVEKAEETALELAATLAKYEGHPFDVETSRKLNEIIIPKVDFQDVNLLDAVGFLRLRAAELDLAETDPAKKGVNIVVRQIIIKAPVSADGEPAEPYAIPTPIIKELLLRNVPLSTVLKHICEATNYRLTIDKFAVTLEPGC